MQFRMTAGLASIVAIGVLGALAGAAPTWADGTSDANNAMTALNAENYDRAIALFTQALNSGQLSTGDRESAYYERGVAYLDKGDYTRATADFQHAVELKPNDADAQSELKIAQAGPTAAQMPPSSDDQSSSTGTASQQNAPGSSSGATSASAARGFFSALGNAMLSGVADGICQGLTGSNCPASDTSDQAPSQENSGGQQADQPARPSPAPDTPLRHTASMDDGNAGMEALNRGDYNTAIRLFARAINAGDLSSGDAELAYFNRAKAYWKLGDEKPAIADLNVAMLLEPSDQDAQVAFGEIMRAHRHQADAGPPQDAAACSANYTATGNFLTGKTYSAWALYPRLSSLDAFAAAFNYMVREQWTVIKVDSRDGVISATESVSNNDQKTVPMEVKVETLPQEASKTTVTVSIAALMVAPDMKGYLCKMLASLPS